MNSEKQLKRPVFQVQGPLIQTRLNGSNLNFFLGELNDVTQREAVQAILPTRTGAQQTLAPIPIGLSKSTNAALAHINSPSLYFLNTYFLTLHFATGLGYLVPIRKYLVSHTVIKSTPLLPTPCSIKSGFLDGHREPADGVQALLRKEIKTFFSHMLYKHPRKLPRFTAESRDIRA